MADAYRGLTLRIGADARPLQSTISSITKSASAAQAQFRKMSKALNFDSTNTAAMARSIDLASDRATHMARAMRQVEAAMRQAENKTVEFSEKSGLAGGKLKDVAASAREVYAATQKIRAEEVSTNAQLQRIYDGAKQVATQMFRGADASEKATAYVKYLQRSLRGSGKVAKAAWQELEILIGKAADIETLAAAFNITKGQAEALVSEFRHLHSESGRFKRDLKAMEEVEGFRAMQTDVILFEAELRQAVAETTRLKAELYSMRGFENVVRDARALDSAVSAAVAEARMMREAYEQLPHSMDTARMKAQAFETVTATLNEKIRATENVLKQIENSRAFDPVAARSKDVYVVFERASQAATDAKTKIEIAEQSLEEFEQELKNVGKADESMDKVSRSAEEIRHDIDKVNNELTELREKAIAADEALERASVNKTWRDNTADLMGYRIELQKTIREASRLTAFSKAAKQVRTFGYGLYSTITPAIMMAGMYGVQAANDIDAAWRDMRKTVNGTEEEFEHLKQAALEFSSTHVTSADTILEIEAMGGQLGIQVENLEAFAHTVSNLDIATNLDSDTISQDLGKMATVMGLNVDQYDKFGDSLVRLGNNMPAMETDIMNAAMRFMGMGKVVGLSADQVLAWATAAVSTGQKAEAGGSSMIRFMSNMETAVTKGGDSLQKWASVAGMSAEDFAEKFRTDASGAMYSFIEGMGNMQKNGDSVNQMLKELGINNVRDKQLLEGLATQMANATDDTNILRDALKMSSDAFNGFATPLSNGKIEKAGDAMREAEKKSAGFSGELSKMKNNAMMLASAMADGAVPIIKDIGGLFQGLTSMVAGLPAEMKTAFVGIAGGAALLGPVSVAFGAVGSSIDGIVKVLKAVPNKFADIGWSLAPIGPTMKKTSAATTALGNAFKFLGTNMGMLVATGAVIAIAAIAGAIQETIRKQEQFKQATAGLRDAVIESSPHIRSLGGELLAAGDNASKAAINYDELIDKQAKLADTIAERNKSGQAEIDQLERARTTIATLLNKHDAWGNATTLTAQEQGKLRAAVELVNKECGTQYKVVDATNGKIADEKGKLLDTAHALEQYIFQKKSAIKQDILAQNYADVYAQQLENIQAVARAKSALESANAAYNEAQTNGTSDEMLINLANDAAAAEQNLKDAKAALDGTSESLGFLENAMAAADEASNSATATFANLVNASAEWRNAFDDDAMFQSFVDGLKTVGVSVDEFEKIGIDGMFAAADAFKQSDGDINAALEAIGVGVTSLEEQMSESLNALGISVRAARHGP